MMLLARVLIGLVALVAVVFAAGLALPREHTATSRVVLNAPADSVWAALRDLGAYPAWHPDFTSSVPGERRNGNEVWVQKAGGMTMSIEVVESRLPRRLVTRVVTDSRSQWGGVWTYAVEADGRGTVVTIIEAGWIQSPLFRVMMTLRGTHATMDGVLKHLAARFGEQGRVEHVGAAR